MIKFAKQRKTVTALQQTKLVKMWLNRQDLAARDLVEQQQLGEEAEAIAEMQEAFKKEESKDQRPEEEREIAGNIEGGEEGLGNM